MTKVALKACIFLMHFLGFKFPMFKKEPTEINECFGYRSESKGLKLFEVYNFKKSLLEMLQILWFVAIHTVYLVFTILALLDIPYFLRYWKAVEIALAIWLSFSVLFYVCLAALLYLKQRTFRKFERKMKFFVNTLHSHDGLVFSRDNVILLLVTLPVHLMSQYITCFSETHSFYENTRDAHYNTVFTALVHLELFSTLSSL